MPQTLIFTGSPGAGVMIAATATALGIAGQGQKTLLVTLGSAIGLSACLGVELGPQPIPLVAGLDLFAPDPNAELAGTWQQNRTQLPEAFARFAADELPLPAGSAALAGLLRLAALRANYQRIVIDAGFHDALLLAAGLPDTIRWFIRILLGLDRGPGQNRSSVMNSLLPSGFLPGGFVDGTQNTRVVMEQTRNEIVNSRSASVCYVLRPDQAALAEARLAIPAIQLHGLAVTSLAIGPQYGETQASALIATAQTWQARSLVSFAMPVGMAIEGFAALAPVLMACDTVDAAAPIAERYGDTPALVIDLPGLPKGALGLTLSGDEMVIRLGPYRRHILLPEALRGMQGIRATREGDRLIIRRR
jgi:arsenite/tail-anchored protein-transporting ATPase